MNRRAAKLLTTAGIFCCVIAPLLLICGIGANSVYTPTILTLCLVGGIVLIVISLAYYTEK